MGLPDRANMEEVRAWPSRGSRTACGAPMDRLRSPRLMVLGAHDSRYAEEV